MEWDDAQGTLKACRGSAKQIGKLTLRAQPLAKPSEDELHQAMLNGIREKGLSGAQLDAGGRTVAHAPALRREVAAGTGLASGG